ncbi:hypothetical protein BsWGS_08532 [Bradybaena similaris]
MEEDWKYASRDKTSKETAKSSRKDRKDKTSGAKTKKKNSKILAQKNTHSTRTAGDLPVNDRDLAEGVVHGGSKDILGSREEENILSNAGSESKREDSPSKRSRSKSRSRSDSRSRFSNFIRRKKKCVSETDISQEIDGQVEKRYESAETVEKADRPKSLDSREDGEAVTSTSQRRSTLKRTSPHHSYDSRIQPRDRLLHMTVADAVKEQQLRRANSANRYSSRGLETNSSTSAIMFLSSPSLAAFMIGSDAARKAFATTATSSTMPAVKSKKPSVLDSLVIAHSLPMSGFNLNNNNAATSLGNDNIDQDMTHIELSPNPRNLIKQPQTQHQKDLINSYKSDADTEITHPAGAAYGAISSSLSSPNDPHQASDSILAHRTPEEDAVEARIKRQASLSQFLELRQTLPPVLSRAHRLSQSSDSGVTSRDTSPCTHPVYPEARQRLREQRSSLPDQKAHLNEKTLNPYVVSSISVSPSSITNPNQSVNGEKMDIGLKETEIITNRPNVLTMEDSMVESSSMSSSPQINSMTSSFRSTDQGYAETDSEDEASFATPPEEVDLTSSGKRERSGRIFHPSILEKLLETTREHPPRKTMQEPDRKTSEIEGLLDSKAEPLQDNRPTQELIFGKETEETKPRYVPRGVRRSQSDAESRHKSSRRLYKRASKPDDGPQRTGSAEGFSTSPSFSREKVTFDLDKLSTPSTVTLTNQDGIDMNIFNVERADQKLVPVMGTVAQQRYRRTYSPSRVRKLIPVLKDENGELSEPVKSALQTQIPDKEIFLSVSAASNELHPKNDLPEKPSQLPLKKLELSPLMPRKGILKSPMKDKVCVSHEDNKESTLKLDSKPSEKVETGSVNEHLTEKTRGSLAKTQSKTQTKSKAEIGDQIMPEIDVCLEATPKVDTRKDAKLKKQKRKGQLTKSETRMATTSKLDESRPTPTVEITYESTSSPIISNSLPGNDSDAISLVASGAAPSKPHIEKSNSASDIIIHSQPHTASETIDSPVGSDRQLTIDFPLIHGLEVGMHKVHSFGGYSLTDYLKEQSKGNWKQQSAPLKVKEAKALKTSLKNKEKATLSLENRKHQSDIRIDKQEVHKQIPKTTHDVTVGEHIRTDIQSNTLKIMVDKECQTSAWLINTLVRNKSSKTKKKASSFSKKKKQQHRRGSSVSDTFVPPDLKRHKESFQHSSLGDIRLACAKEPNFTNRLVRGSSEKPRRHRDDKLCLKPIAGSSSKSYTDTSKTDDSSPLPKPKKLSLSAVILLKNRLAKYRERKRGERPALEAVDDEPCINRVSSETLITIENELNLSKLEVSKETDIIDDDFYEPEFSLGYTRKQLRFEALPNEPMQSEEPLPPLPTSRRMRQRRESTLRERKRKCVQYCKKFIAFLFSHVGLCSLVVAYTILGGFIFQALENKAESTVRSTIRSESASGYG